MMLCRIMRHFMWALYPFRAFNYAKLTPVLLNPDMYTLDNSVDPDQLTSDEATRPGSAYSFRAVSECTILIERA